MRLADLGSLRNGRTSFQEGYVNPSVRLNILDDVKWLRAARLWTDAFVFHTNRNLRN